MPNEPRRFRTNAFTKHDLRLLLFEEFDWLLSAQVLHFPSALEGYGEVLHSPRSYL
jgi:hypothetical protein